MLARYSVSEVKSNVKPVSTCMGDRQARLNAVNGIVSILRCAPYSHSRYRADTDVNQLINYSDCVWCTISKNLFN